VDRRSWIALLALAALWGASYLFIKVGLEDGLSPGVIVFVRLALAAAVLIPVAAARGALRGIRAVGLGVVVLALVQVAAPFMLITVGEVELSSSLTGILVASAPIWTALLAVRLDAAEQSRGWELVGVGLGIVGVGVLLGVDLAGDRGALLGGLAVILASMGYAVGGFMVKRRFGHLQPVGLVAATMVASAVMAAPFALATPPSAAPGGVAVAAMVALGVGGTGIAFVIYYTLISGVGPARTSLVAYIAPVFAVIYGVTLLDERVTLGTLGGLVLILAGSWLAAGGSVRGRAPSRAATVAGRG
jgi:drug/metabolite transporter (DMT)-like permease